MFEMIPPEDYSKALAQAGVPQDVTGLVMYLFTLILDGRNAYLTDRVQRALSREPRDFTDYANDSSATRVWRNQR